MPLISSPAPPPLAAIAVLTTLAAALLSSPAAAGERCRAPVQQRQCEAVITHARVGFFQPLPPAPASTIQLANVPPTIAAAALRGHHPDLLSPAATAPTTVGLRAIQRRLLRREVEAVERLLQLTPTNANERPRVLRRLADGYAELAAQQTANASAATAIAAPLASSLRGNTSARAPLAPRRHHFLMRRAHHDRRVAIAYYQQLLREYPDYCHFAGHIDPTRRSCGDEVHRYLADEWTQLGDERAALYHQQQLLSQWPTSRYAAGAALFIAEAQFAAAREDATRWPRAQAAYRRVLTQPSLPAQVGAYARYKLAHTYWNVAQGQRAITAFAQVINATRAPHAQGTVDPTLVAASWRDLVRVYAQSGDASAAYPFFLGLHRPAPHRPAPLAGDSPAAMADHQRTLNTLAQLANVSLRFGEYQRANQVMAVLLQHSTTSDQRCALRTTMARATAAAAIDMHTAVVALAALRDHYHHLSKATPAPSRTRCRWLLLHALGETILRWHAEALLDHHGARVASRKLHRWFTQLLETHQSIDRDRHRSTPKWLSNTLYAAGELAAASGDHRACAHAFHAAGASAASVQRQHDARVAEAGCWLRSALAPTPAADKLAALARRSPRRSATDKVDPNMPFERFLCEISPRADDERARAQRLAISLAHANHQRDHGDLAAAAAEYRLIARTAASREARAYAANAYLSCMEVLRALGRPLPCGGP